MIDNSTLLIGIAFSGASLMIALSIGWLNSRQETYLVHGAGGISLIVVAVTIMGLRGDRYELVHTLLPFSLIIVGLALVYSGSRLFRNRAADNRPAVAVALGALPVMAVPFLLGYSGIGTIVLNLVATLIMLLCAREYWRGRREGQVAMLANMAIYSLTGVSFLACAAMLILQQDWVLTSAADNWAEDFNSIMTLAGLTGIGAITLTLHHARAARQHHAEANTDALTGVFNRRALFGRFAENHVAANLPVLMFDLDHFKLINDRLGHAEGDLVLQRFADVLRDQLRASDIIARLGGEEFCVILPQMDRDHARDAAERVRAAFAGLNIAIGDGEIATVSVGLAIGGAKETFSSVLRRADDALYRAKSAGRNQVHLAALRLVA